MTQDRRLADASTAAISPVLGASERPDEENPAIKATESALRHPPGNRAAAEPGSRQVGRRHDAVPPCRESKNRPITVQISTHDAFRIGCVPCAHTGDALRTRDRKQCLARVRNCTVGRHLLHPCGTSSRFRAALRGIGTRPARVPERMHASVERGRGDRPSLRAPFVRTRRGDRRRRRPRRGRAGEPAAAAQSTGGAQFERSRRSAAPDRPDVRDLAGRRRRRRDADRPLPVAGRPRRVRVRIDLLPASGGRAAATLRLGRRPTNRDLTATWRPSLKPGRYTARLRATAPRRAARRARRPPPRSRSHPPPPRSHTRRRVPRRRARTASAARPRSSVRGERGTRTRGKTSSPPPGHRS